MSAISGLLCTLGAPALRRFVGWQLARVALLCLALWLLRFELARCSDVDPRELGRHALYVGLGFDLAAALAIEIVALAVAGLARRGWLLTWVGATLVCCGSQLAYVLYDKYFSSPLHLWILAYHWSDLVAVSGSIGTLGSAWRVAAAIALIAAAGGLAVRKRRLPASTDRSPRQVAAAALAGAVAAFAVSVAVNQRLIARHSRTEKSTLLAAQALHLWAAEVRDAVAEGFGAGDPHHPSVILGLLRDSSAQTTEQSQAVARTYRDQHRATPVAEAVDPRWPLYRPLPAPDPATVELRRRLGFAADTPLNVVVVFVETWRALEFVHPELGPQVFPRLHALFDRHALWFDQGYSAAIEAGMTVRGQLGALCSMLPGNGGPAAYIAFPDLALACLPQMFRQAGYRTAWFYGQNRRFHNTGAFEQRHGTELFFDEAFFRDRGISLRIGDWGLADRPVLQETLRQLIELDGQGTPFFADIIT
ncbi:MAG: sulfatase-like hydrolase/transferase, partial [Deltaproteobacteria bacterium]|nr:sulfatase-like hydrolase/transferase [Deltaproteobacteria bacterium]